MSHSPNPNETIVEDKEHASIDDPMGRGEGKGEGDRMGKGSADKRISEESPISNIKDESDRSEDDPDRSEGI